MVPENIALEKRSGRFGWVSPADGRSYNVEAAAQGWVNSVGLNCSSEYFPLITILTVSVLFDRFRYDRKCDREIYQDIVFGQLYPKEVQELASVDCKAQWLEARLGKMSAKTALQISLS